MLDPLGKELWSRPINSIMTIGYALIAFGLLAASGLIGLVALVETRSGGKQESGGWVCFAVGPVAALVLGFAAWRNSEQRLFICERGVRWTRFFGGAVECTYADICTVQLINLKLNGVIPLGADGVRFELRDGRVLEASGVSDPITVAEKVADRCKQAR